MQASLNFAASYIIIFLPISLISGAFLADLSVVLIDILFLYHLYKEKNFKYLNNIFFKFLIIFNIYISIRSIFADDLFFSLKSSLTYFRFTILIFAIKFFLERDQKLLNIFSKVFVATILILFIDSLFQYINGYNLLGFKIENPDKLNSLFGDEGVLGSYLIRLLPLFLVSLLNFNKNNYLFVLTLFTFAIFIFLSGSRSSIALYILFFFTFFLVFIQYRKILIYYFVVLFTLTYLIIQNFNFNLNETKNIIISEEDQKRIEKNLDDKLSYTAYYNFVDPLKRIFKDGKNLGQITIFSEVYDSHYRTAYKMFVGNPLFGVGNKMFRKLCNDQNYLIDKFSCSTHPHNLYLQILAENGFIGFIFLILILIYTVSNIVREFFYRNFKKIKKINDKQLLLLMGVFLNFWPIIPFGNFYNNWLSILIYLPIGFLLYFSSTND